MKGVNDSINGHLQCSEVDECGGDEGDGPGKGTGEAHGALVPQRTKVARQPFPARGPQGRYHFQVTTKVHKKIAIDTFMKS